MFNFLGKEDNPDATSAGEKPVDEVLDKEEIRRRRLMKVNTNSQASTSVNSDAETTKLSSNTSSLTLSTESVAKTSDEHKSKITKISDSPIKEKLSTVPVSSIASPMKGDRDAIVLNLTLEFVLKSTLRREGADSDCYYLGNYLKNSGELIKQNNLQELICARLENKASVFNAISYLLSCYKRLLSREGASSGSTKDALQGCKTQIVSFVGSCLGIPDMFETASTSCQDLVMAIAEDASNSTQSFVRDVLEDLEKQEYLHEVLGNMLDKIYALLNPGAQQLTMTMPGQPAPAMRSVLDNYSTAIAALNALLREKRAAKTIATHAHFQPKGGDLDVAGLNVRNVPPMLMHNPLYVEAQGRLGCAIEHRTLLGRLLRIAADPRDPKIHEMFKDVTRQPRNVMEGKINDLRQRMQLAVSSASEAVLSLLKAGGVAKEQTLLWLKQAIVFNAEAGKDRPSPLLSGSAGYSTNLAGLLLHLARPVFEDPEKLKKADLSYLLCAEGRELFPSDSTKLLAKTGLPADVVRSIDSHHTQAVTLAESTAYSFITQSLLLCWRAVHLGVVPRCNQYVSILRGLNHFSAGLETGDAQAMQYLVMKLVTDAQLLAPALLKDLLGFVVGAARLLMSRLETPASYQTLTVQRTVWLVEPADHSVEVLSFLSGLPEHLLDDLATLLLFLAKAAPASLLEVGSLEPVLSLILFFLRRPFAVQSPHLRAKLGNALYNVFLPVAARGQQEMYTHLKSVDGPHTALLAGHLEAQKFLAPALLLLYGDVERTGYYEKLSNRRAIMIVLKHLWTLPTHRAAFQGIAISKDFDNNAGNSSSGAESASAVPGSNSFIRFANGLLNETNALVATTMDKLSEIRKTQLLMQNQADWGRLDEEERKRVAERHESNEMECKGSAGLCLETLNMLNYLTSDAIIRRPFLSDEILPRFTSTLLNVVQRMVGSKSLEIKVERMEEYNFEPRTMLAEVAQAMAHFSSADDADTKTCFATAVAQDSFYSDGVPLRKAIQTVARLNLLQPAELDQLRSLADTASSVRGGLEDLEALADDAPFDFLDPLLSTLMRDPVMLPTSQTVIDRSTIAQHLLNVEIDPFNRKPLTMDMVQPLPELKTKIDEWIRGKKAEMANKL